MKSWLFKSCLFLSLMGFSTASFAGFAFSGLSDSEFKDVVGDFTSNFTYTTVSGANSLGSLFGFELGLIAGQTDAPNIKKVSPEVSSLPHAGLIGAITLPMGFTVDAMLIPKTTMGDGSLSNTGIGVKYTMGFMPVHVAVRGFTTMTQFDFTQGTDSIKFHDSIYGAQLLASFNAMVLEPYLGLGYVKGSGKLEGSTSLFGFTASDSATKDVSGTQLLAGVEVKLMFLKLGFEYSKIVDSSRYTGKLSFYF